MQRPEKIIRTGKSYIENFGPCLVIAGCGMTLGKKIDRSQQGISKKSVRLAVEWLQEGHYAWLCPKSSPVMVPKPGKPALYGVYVAVKNLTLYGLDLFTDSQMCYNVFIWHASLLNYQIKKKIKKNNPLLPPKTRLCIGEASMCLELEISLHVFT